MTDFLKSFPEPLHWLTRNSFARPGVDKVCPQMPEVFEECSWMPEVAVHVLVAVTDDDRLTSGPLGLEQPHIVRRHCVLQLKEAAVTQPGVPGLSTYEAALLFGEDMPGSEADHFSVFPCLKSIALTQPIVHVFIIF